VNNRVTLPPTFSGAYVKVIIKPGERGNLDIRVPDIAIKTAALRVIVEVGDAVAEIVPANGLLLLKTPSGQYYYKKIEIIVRDVFSIEDRPPDMIIHNAVCLY
jgi:hypothetical protein